nr:TRAP transporter large permease subunit [Thermus altitudinis]
MLIACFVTLLLLRVPVAGALGASAVLVIAMGGLGLQVVSFNFQAGIAKFPLLAIPFFILAGTVMDRAGIAERIVRLLLAAVGGWRAGAAVATVLAGMFWGGGIRLWTRHLGRPWRDPHPHDAAPGLQKRRAWGAIMPRTFSPGIHGPPTVGYTRGKWSSGVRPPWTRHHLSGR